jgi:ribosomal protein L17
MELKNKPSFLIFLKMFSERKTEEQEKGRVSSQKAREILQKEGLEVTEQQAYEILQFLQKLASVAMNQCVKEFG